MSGIGEMTVAMIDGEPVVQRADATIEVYLNVLAEGQRNGTVTFDQHSGEYVFAGQVAYRIRALNGATAVMDRVRDLR